MAYGTRRFNSAFTRALHSPITQFLLLISISLRSILILSSHLHLGFPNGVFPVSLPGKILKALLPSSILATWSACLNFLYLITLTILCERYKLHCIIFINISDMPFLRSITVFQIRESQTCTNVSLCKSINQSARGISFLSLSAGWKLGVSLPCEELRV